jgi:hypothetical protein
MVQHTVAYKVFCFCLQLHQCQTNSQGNILLTIARESFIFLEKQFVVSSFEIFVLLFSHFSIKQCQVVLFYGVSFASFRVHSIGISSKRFCTLSRFNCVANVLRNSGTDFCNCKRTVDVTYPFSQHLEKMSEMIVSRSWPSGSRAIQACK